jgi:hypothetical protein
MEGWEKKDGRKYFLVSGGQKTTDTTVPVGMVDFPTCVCTSCSVCVCLQDTNKNVKGCTHNNNHFSSLLLFLGAHTQTNNPVDGTQRVFNSVQFKFHWAHNTTHTICNRLSKKHMKTCLVFWLLLNSNKHDRQNSFSFFYTTKRSNPTKCLFSLLFGPNRKIGELLDGEGK